MTGEQYVRANKRVYNVVIILLAVMTILSVMACLAEFKITILLQTAAAVAGIIVVNTYAKKFWNSKKGGEILLGTGSAVYCVFLLLNQNNFVYAYGIPRDFALKNKNPCSACEFQAKQGISIWGIKLLFFSV